jgi:putative phosphoesterase
MARVGLISDTHGLLRAEATAFLRGSDLIIHAGDIGDASVLEELATLAPVTAVRGNNDHGAWAAHVPPTATVRVDGVRIHVVHDVAEVDETPLPRGVRVVVAGHSHKPSVRERDGLVFVNPGSAGPRRFSLPIAVGELRIAGTSVRARIVELEVAPTARRRRTP